MPGMNGIELAGKIHEKQPEVSIIFLTGYSQYALEAYAVQPTGYLLKPVKKEKLAEELAYAASAARPRNTGRIAAHTFGNFDLLVDEKPVVFRQARFTSSGAFPMATLWGTWDSMARSLLLSPKA